MRCNVSEYRAPIRKRRDMWWWSSWECAIYECQQNGSWPPYFPWWRLDWFLFTWAVHYRAFPRWHCLRVRYRAPRLWGYRYGTGPLDTDSSSPVPDPEPRLWGLSWGPVVCEMRTYKSRDTGPYLHVYVATVILPTKTHVEVSLCCVRHLWSSKGNQSVFTVMHY